jgi:hypothetical protein
VTKSMTDPRDYVLAAAGLIRTPQPKPEPPRSFDDIAGQIYPHLKVNREKEQRK